MTLKGQKPPLKDDEQLHASSSNYKSSIINHQLFDFPAPLNLLFS